MDTHAHLRSYGWRGPGHSLHPTSDSTGLARPLLVSQKRSNDGVGKKQHKTSDMWWMNAFDKTLKGLNTEDGKVVLGRDICGGLEKITMGTRGGLYEGFVKGEGLRGTLMLGERKESQTQERGEKLVDAVRKAERRAKKTKRRLEKNICDGGSTINSSEASHERRNRRKSELKAIKTKREHRARRAVKAPCNDHNSIPSSNMEMNVP